MTTTSPRTPEGNPPGSNNRATADRAAAADVQIERLKAELAAVADKSRQAVISYEIGHLTQFGLHNEAQAVREYLGAYNLDPGFRPPLIALVQIFERRRSSKNLVRLYEAEGRSAATPREAASAQADRAVLLSDQLGNPEEGRPLLENAFEQAAEAQDIALLLEHQMLAEGDRAGALRIIEARADLIRDPVLATLLRLELARAKEDDGDIDGALSVLRSAVTTPAARWRVLDQLERVARKAERYPELIVALEGRAKLAAADARGEDHGQTSGAFSVQRFRDRELATAAAAALYREAGHLRRTKLGDPAGAMRDYGEALGLRPDDVLLRYERMLACELNGDLDLAAEEATSILATGLEGAVAGTLHFRLAEHAQVEGDADAALAAMRAALAADPDSAVAAAMLDDLLRGMGELASTVDQLVARAALVEGGGRAQRLWEAAQLCADRLNDAERASALFAQAAAASSAPAPILREALAAALRLGDATSARAHAEALLETDIDDEERSAILRDLHELLRLVLEDDAAADLALDKALDTPAAGAWAPDLARLSAARGQNYPLLARAHRALAERAADAETAAAHLCAAARALARAGQDDAAVDALRASLEKSPTHPYAAALLEEVLRASGRADEVVRLLREAAEKSDAPRAAMTQLLLAGAAAEAADDFDEAIRAYDEAAERDPSSLAPLLALRRLADARPDPALLLRSLEALSQREIAADEPGRHTLALGEHYDLVVGKPELAEAPLRTALESESVGLHAAVDLSLLPIGGEARLEGLLRLLAQASDEARPGLLREAAGAALAKKDLVKARELLTELRERAPRDRWSPLGWMRLLAAEPTQRAADETGADELGADEPREDEPRERGARGEAWMSLGHATDDADVAAELLLSGLRAQVYGRGEEALDDAVIIAHEVMAIAPDSLAAAVALDETLSAGDDPDGRADALGSWRGHLSATEDGGAKPASGTLAMESAHGRALAAAGRSREALEALLRVAVRETEDLASWEAIRGCARDCEAWEPLVEACDRLAHLIGDEELTSMLLEESAAVLMDELQQDARAERRLRRVLAIDARRPIAYGRLHDLLADRGDDAGLLALVAARIDLVDEPSELVKLFYEQARLLRSLGMREDALGALDNLLMLDGNHLGGLALLVELQVQQENWRGAVEALSTLASADDVPDSQRRIARLGAADFLENRLDDREAAFEQLSVVHELGLADRQIYERMAQVAQTLERYDEAAEAIANAVVHAGTPQAIAKLERRAGALHAEHRLDRAAAIAAYERALATMSTDLKAAEALAELLDGPERDALSRRFESSVRYGVEVEPGKPEHLRKLARAAVWRGDVGLETAVLSVLRALDLATEEERALFDQRAAASRRALPRGSVGPSDLASIRAPGDGGPALVVAQAVAESVAEMDGLDPSGFALGRSDLVKTDTPMRAELRALTSMWGLPEPDLYVGGDVPTRIDLMPSYKGKPTWVIGAGVRSPLDPDQRFTVGMLASGAALGVGPLVRRGEAGAATALFAAAAAAEAPLPLGEGRAGMAEATRRIYKAMPRKLRKSLPELLAPITDGGRSIDAWARFTARSANHGGLLAANDLQAALERVLGPDPDPELITTNEDARDLLLFWISERAVALRQKLGLST